MTNEQLEKADLTDTYGVEFEPPSGEREDGSTKRMLRNESTLADALPVAEPLPSVARSPKNLNSNP